MEQQLRWFGYIIPMKEKRIVKVILEIELGIKKRRGRSRSKWNTKIAYNLRRRRMSWYPINQAAKDK